MKRITSAIIFCLSTALAWSDDGFNAELGHGWRFTAGPQFNFGAKGRLGVKSGAIPTPAPYSSSTKAAAQAAGDGISVGTGRTDFPNGGYIDPNDAAGIAGETWNWRIPAGQLTGTQTSFSHPYTEQTTTYSAIGGSDKDDAYSVGANFGLDRTVWKWCDFGVDAGFNFSFFIKDKWFKGASGGYTRTDTYTEGTYNTDVDFGNADVFSDPWAQNPDGSWGAGSFDGPGPVLDLDDISVSHNWGEERTSLSTTSRSPFSIRGDLQMYEFQFALKPELRLLYGCIDLADLISGIKRYFFFCSFIRNRLFLRFRFILGFFFRFGICFDDFFGLLLGGFFFDSFGRFFLC